MQPQASTPAEGDFRKGWDLGDPPLEHRFLGMDRRLFLPTIAVVVVLLFYGGVIPAIDESMDADVFESGDVVTIKGPVSFEPAPGWVADDLPSPSAPAVTIFRDGVSFKLQPGAWDGTADELLDQIIGDFDYVVQGDKLSFTLPDGVEGRAIRLQGVDKDGALFALVSDKNAEAFGFGTSGRVLAVRVVVSGPPEVLNEGDFGTEIGEMIASIKIAPEEAEGAGQ